MRRVAHDKSGAAPATVSERTLRDTTVLKHGKVKVSCPSQARRPAWSFTWQPAVGGRRPESVRAPACMVRLCVFSTGIHSFLQQWNDMSRMFKLHPLAAYLAVALPALADDRDPKPLALSLIHI